MSISQWLRGQIAFTGRRTARKGNKKPYHFQPRYVAIEGTQRHCYIHPREVATHFELNTQDKSYKRPVCAGCAA